MDNFYEVYVEGIGVVFDSGSYARAKGEYNLHVRISRERKGQREGAGVILYENGDPIAQYKPLRLIRGSAKPTAIKMSPQLRKAIRKILLEKHRAAGTLRLVKDEDSKRDPRRGRMRTRKRRAPRG